MRSYLRSVINGNIVYAEQETIYGDGLIRVSGYLHDKSKQTLNTLKKGMEITYQVEDHNGNRLPTMNGKVLKISTYDFEGTKQYSIAIKLTS